MLAIADIKQLYILEFVDSRVVTDRIKELELALAERIIPGIVEPISLVQEEIGSYFAGKLRQFKTPLCFNSTDFQMSCWRQLLQVPYGQTISYLEQARSIGRDKAYRAVANANAANRIAILIPCHRIIGNNGAIGGYRSGVWRKKWLLCHEMMS